MAAPSFVGAGSGAAVATGILSLSKTSCTAGNFIIVHVFLPVTVSSVFDAASNVEDLTGTDDALTIAPSTHWQVGNPAAGRHAAYFGRVIANGTVTVDIDSTSGTAAILGRIYEFSGVHTGTTNADVIDNTAGSNDVRQVVGTSTTVSAATVTTSDTERLGFQLVCVKSDQALDAFTGETGGNWVEAVAEYTSSSPAGAIGLQTADIPTAGSVTGGSDTITSTDWAVMGSSLIPAPAGGGGGGGSSGGQRMLTFGLG